MAAKKKTKKAKAGAGKKKAKAAPKKSAAKKAIKKKAPARKAAAKKAARRAAPTKTARKKAPARKARQVVGEGDYQASRTFLKEQAAFVKKNKARIPAMGKAAERALEGPEGANLRAAEAKARAHAAPGSETGTTEPGEFVIPPG